MASITDRVRSAWNAFTSEEDQPFRPPMPFYSGSMGVNPNRTRSFGNSERTIISSIYTRLSIDIASIDIRHTRHDDSDRYLEDIQSGLNNCLTVEANLDQAARAFRQDIVLTLFSKGVAVIVPVDTTIDPKVSSGYDIQTLRVGEVVQWYPNHVRVNLYNEAKGMRQEITLAKRTVAIVENPLYSVMNEPNSTLQRLMRKLALLDTVDESTSSGKLDMIIQLPYVIKSEQRREQAEQRRKDIEFQLMGSQYGIAYTDGTEKITQLNRPVENNLLEKIVDLKTQLYAELGLTATVMDGTANEATMLNYNNRTVEPTLAAITEAMARSFITKTARTQGQRIDYFRDPFKLVPMSTLAEMADKFTRNEIFSSNEIRQFVGAKPSKDPKADQLINSNMPQADTGLPTANAADPAADTTTSTSVVPDNASVNVLSSSFDDIDASIDAAFSNLGIDAGDDNANS